MLQPPYMAVTVRVPAFNLQFDQQLDTDLSVIDAANMIESRIKQEVIKYIVNSNDITFNMQLMK